MRKEETLGTKNRERHTWPLVEKGSKQHFVFTSGVQVLLCFGVQCIIYKAEVAAVTEHLQMLSA